MKFMPDLYFPSTDIEPPTIFKTKLHPFLISKYFSSFICIHSCFLIISLNPVTPDNVYILHRLLKVVSSSQFDTRFCPIEISFFYTITPIVTNFFIGIKFFRIKRFVFIKKCSSTNILFCLFIHIHFP